VVLPELVNILEFHGFSF
jgi:hypothetical protein